MKSRKFNDNWKEYVLYDLANWKNGLAFNKINFSEDGYPIIKIAELKNGITSQTNFTKDKCSEEVYLRKNDLIFSWSGNPETSIDAYLYDLPEGYLNQHSFKVTPHEFINKYFLFYVLKYLKPIFKKIASNKQTTGLGHITISDLKNLRIKIPTMEIQEKFLKIIKRIDDKIKLNNQTNDNLYELGDALYKEYYSKYENELPNGYKYLNLNEVSVNFDSKRKPMSSREREQHKGIYPYYGATSIIDYVDDYIFDDTYLLMGEDGTVKTNEGYPVLQYIWGKNWINNHAHVLQGTIISTEHLMFALRKKNIESLITGAVQPKINQVNMNKIKIIIGTDKVNKKFEEKIKIIVAKIKANTIENETLIQLRDTLLPKLMNGEIDLDKIEI